MSNNNNAFEKEFISNIIESIQGHDNALKRHQKAEKPSVLMIEQFQELRDERIAFLMEYLIERGWKEPIKSSILKLESLRAA
jgi:TATA-binding protein-associated factor Taf7